MISIMPVGNSLKITYQLFTLDTNVEGISLAGGKDSGIASATTASASLIIGAAAMRTAEAKRKNCLDAIVYTRMGSIRYMVVRGLSRE